MSGKVRERKEQKGKEMIEKETKKGKSSKTKSQIYVKDGKERKRKNPVIENTK